MSEKRKRRGKQECGKLNVDTKVGAFQGSDFTGIGAIMNGPCTGDQKIKTEIETVTVDNNGLLIGAAIRRCTEDES